MLSNKFEDLRELNFEQIKNLTPKSPRNFKRKGQKLPVAVRARKCIVSLIKRLVMQTNSLKSASDSK